LGGREREVRWALREVWFFSRWSSYSISSEEVSRVNRSK
jgi:hypothetical protein